MVCRNRSVAGVTQVRDGLRAGVPPPEDIRLGRVIETGHVVPDSLAMQHRGRALPEGHRLWVKVGRP